MYHTKYIGAGMMNYITASFCYAVPIFGIQKAFPFFFGFLS